MTCAYDLYRIMLGCLQYSDFISISSTPAYYKKADSILDRDIPMGTTNKLIKKDSDYYTPFVVCGKTGWTEELDAASLRIASKNGRNLICVTMNTEDPNQYKDTIQLLITDLTISVWQKLLSRIRPIAHRRLSLTARLVFLSKIPLF
mgnify:CR=1 FL=1